MLHVATAVQYLCQSNAIAMEGVEEGVKKLVEIVKDVRFADDQGMIASSETDLQKIINDLNDTVTKYDMRTHNGRERKMCKRNKL